ncbi:MAG: hypothetical protein R3C68_18490 [Myxococcota bacterium]
MLRSILLLATFSLPWGGVHAKVPVVVVELTAPILGTSSQDQLDINYLLQRLNLRLVPLGLRAIDVKRRPVDRSYAYALRVKGNIQSAEIYLRNPRGTVLVNRQISLNGRSAHDIAHTIVLTVVESMTPIIKSITTAPQAPEEEGWRRTGTGHLPIAARRRPLIRRGLPRRLTRNPRSRAAGDQTSRRRRR